MFFKRFLKNYRMEGAHLKGRLTLNHIEEIVNTQRNLLSGAVIGLALSGNTCSYGFVRFLGSNEPSLSPFLFDYSSHRIVRKLVSVEEAIELIQWLILQDEMKDMLPETAHFRLSQGNNPLQRLGSKDDDGFLVVPWPRWYLRSQITYNSPPKLSPHRKHLSGKDLPFFPSFKEAIATLFELNKHEFKYGLLTKGGDFEIILPDFRGRISSIMLRQNEIIVDMECNLPHLSEMYCKFYVRGKEKAYHHSQRVSKNSKAHYMVNEAPLMISLLLVDAEDNEIDCVTVDLQEQTPEWIIRKYSEEEVESLLDQGEGFKVEYKLEIPRGAPHEFVESVSAFANTEGGKILIGVDNNANVVGCRRNQKQRIEDIIASHIEPEIHISMTEITINEKVIAIVEVPEGIDKPYVVRNRGSYKRVGATDMQLSRLDLERTMEKRVVLTDSD